MRRAVHVHRAGHWGAEYEVGTVTLAVSDRHRRRIRMIADDGNAFLLDLVDAVMLTDGDGLGLEDGGIIRVRAAEEDVADIACDGTEHLARMAWHLGNRHLPVQILPGGILRITWDHVIAAMAEGLGGTVTRHKAAFQPEGGAYSGGGHGHGHSHDHDHDHDHGHHHGHDHAH